jgi:hypothetical protein
MKLREWIELAGEGFMVCLAPEAGLQKESQRRREEAK